MWACKTIFLGYTRPISRVPHLRTLSTLEEKKSVLGARSFQTVEALKGLNALHCLQHMAKPILKLLFSRLLKI